MPRSLQRIINAIDHTASHRPVQRMEQEFGLLRRAAGGLRLKKRLKAETKKFVAFLSSIAKQTSR